MQGGVRLRAERIGGRTRITDLACRPPLQVLRAHHVDPGRPDLASVILASPAGGILQGDRLTIDIRVGPDARLRVGTQSATRIYRAPADEARQVVRLEVEAGGYLEYLPDPFIPYAGSRFTSSTAAIVAAEAALIIGEVVTPGRAARGEVLAFERFESTVEIARPDGMLLATDAVILDRHEPMRVVGALGRYVAVGTLLVIRSGFPPSILRDAGINRWGPSVSVGASTLPNDAGAWLRVLSASFGEAVGVLEAAHAAAKQAFP
jgi:urease accessory protein